MILLFPGCHLEENKNREKDESILMTKKDNDIGPGRAEDEYIERQPCLRKNLWHDQFQEVTEIPGLNGDEDIDTFLKEIDAQVQSRQINKGHAANKNDGDWAERYVMELCYDWNRFV